LFIALTSRAGRALEPDTTVAAGATSPWRAIIGIVARDVGAGVATHSARWNSAGRLASISRLRQNQNPATKT
jgi:hypothetical protein